MENNNSKTKNLINLLKKIVNSKPFDIINKIFLTSILLSAAYFSYGKWQFWLFIIIWLFVVPNIFANLLIKFLKKYVIKKYN